MILLKAQIKIREGNETIINKTNCGVNGVKYLQVTEQLCFVTSVQPCCDFVWESAESNTCRSRAVSFFTFSPELRLYSSMVQDG